MNTEMIKPSCRRMRDGWAPALEYDNGGVVIAANRCGTMNQAIRESCEMIGCMSDYPDAFAHNHPAPNQLIDYAERMSAHTDNERSEAAVDAQRLVRLYDWLRLENHHGETIACGGIFPNEEIKKGQRWQGSSGHTVTIESVNNHSVYYSWVERGAKLTHNKEHFAFQCRYCLILQNDQAEAPR